MGWLSKIFQKDRGASKYTLSAVQENFSNFLAILENNNKVLRIISDMEEKAQGEYLFDINYIRSSITDVRSGVLGITEGMIALGGDRYEPLRERYKHINDEISKFFPENKPVEKDEYVIPLGQVGREKSWSVGSKGAQLGEMKSKLDLPVPEGFAVSAWAYKHFVDANDLQKRISDRINSVHINHYDDLVRVSEQIRSMVSSGQVPDDLADAIRSCYAETRKRVPGVRFSLRSSAIGEDTLFSFAGQYASFLNVREHELIDRYREVLANKFTTQAIYYYLSHSFAESDLAMGVCCLAMVDAVSSGVIYTRDPVQPQDDRIVIYAIYGLGKYLVDGTLTPDIYQVSREDGRVTDTNIAKKRVRLVLSENGGTVEEPVPESEWAVPVLDEERAGQLAAFARKIEEHYGTPMDIEWAIDRTGQPFILQARPLRVIETHTSEEEPDVSNLEVLCSGGTTVCPGAGSGPVFHLQSTNDLARVPDGAVLVAPLPFPGLVTVMDKVGALVTHVGSTASHMATLAREYGIPTLVGLKEAQSLAEGQDVTVDATGQAVYAGVHPDLVQVRRQESEAKDDEDIFDLLGQVLKHVAPLNLLHPDDADYVPENCRTFHDITRFVHQKAMAEMFSLGKNIKDKDRIALKLKSDIPLKVLIIYIDQDLSAYKGKREVSEDAIASVPMKAFWDGVKEEGWPAHTPGGDAKGFGSVVATGLATNIEGEFSESSFAVLSKEYMILSLRMGYHFTTVEAMCTEEASSNYIRFQCKGGGASVARRSRRIRLFEELLASMGFGHTGKGDFIDARIAYQNPADLANNLRLIGHITMITKQLDMALSNESITNWYIKDFKKKLGLTDDGGSNDA
jgi:pyruvate,water dikinase